MAKSIEQLDKNFKKRDVPNPEAYTWRDAAKKPFTVRGLAWHNENKGSFYRLPPRAEGVVRDAVWNLARNTASARIAFRTDATSMAVRVTNNAGRVMQHMAPSGTRGVTLYAGEPGRMRYWVTGIPDLDNLTWDRPLFDGLTKRVREFRLYLPLYRGVDAVEIGLSKGARVLAPSPPAVAKPVVVYGTSITQGGCASTAGADFVSTVGRRMNLDVINLGFSGNGKGEPEMAHLIAEIDASLVVLDYAANVDAKRLAYTLPRFMSILREKHPEMPILIVTSPCYSRVLHQKGAFRQQEDKRDAMIAAYARRRKQGDRNVYFADGWGMIPFGADAAYVDGVHPSSHGFQIYADALCPFIEMILLRDQ